MLKAPSARELSPQATEGETKNLTAAKSQALSPTRFAGAPSQRGPSCGYSCSRYTASMSLSTSVKCSSIEQ